MNQLPFADLHIHSIYSDGSYLPQELVEAAEAAGLGTIALTDHDSVTGVEPTVEAAAGRNVRVIPGAELSVRLGDEEIHIIGLYVNPHNSRLNQSLDELRMKRQLRIVEIAEKLRKLQIRINPQEIIKRCGRGTVGRLHVAEQLLERGITSSIGESFWKYLGDKSAAFVPKPDFPLEDACRLIHDAHGIAVLAHPGTEPDEGRIASMVDLGLDALEAYYPIYDQAITNRYIEIATNLGLGISGGSDCHGDMKGNIFLGQIKVPGHYVDELERKAAAWA